MKKLLLGMVLVPALTVQAAELTPYILINKEYRHLSQDDSAKKGSSTGITDVDGFETRIGAKASRKLESGMTATAKVELGVNTAMDNGASDNSKAQFSGERIRIRLAQAGVAGNFGAVTVGKHWNPNTLRMLSLDPFTATGAQLLGLESGDVEGAKSGNFGMKARYFNDGITYASPKMHGAQFSITADQNADDLDKDSDGNTEKWTTAMLTYDRKFGEHTLNLHVTKAMGSVEHDFANNSLDNDEDFLTVGAKFSCKKLGFSAAYTKEGKAEATKGVDVERKHVLAAAWYNMGNLTLGLNYGKTEFGEKENFVTGDNGKGGEQTQIGAGAIYKLSKNVKTRLIYRKQTVKTNGDTNIVGTTKENKANAFITGITMSF